MKIKKITKLQGFTMVEMMVTMLIFSIVSGALYMVMVTGDNSWQTSNVKIELQQELRKAMDWIKDDLRESGSSAIVNVDDDGAWYSSITFKKSTGVSGGMISWSSNTIQFILGGPDGDQLQRISGGNTKVLAQDINSFQVRRLPASADIVEISMVAQKDTPRGNAISSQLDFQVQLRN